MDELITQLIEVLQLELAAYQKFYTIKEEERGILVKSKEKDIFDNVKDQENMLSHIGQMEQERLAVIKEIENSCDLQAGELRLKELIPLLPEEYQSSLTFIREQLISAMDNVNRINTGNAELTRNALKFIDMNVKFLIGDTEEGNEFYEGNSKKEKHPDSRKRVLDCKV